MSIDKLFLLWFLIFFNACKSQNNSDNRRINDVVPIVHQKKVFFDADVSNLMTVHALVNKTDSAIFILDNGTMDNYCIIFDKKYALNKNLITTGDPREINKFQDSAKLDIQFGHYNFMSTNNRIMDLPVSEKIAFDGLLGMGFLKNYILEIDYHNDFFKLDTVFSLDAKNYHEIQLEKSGMFLKMPVVFYINGRAISKTCILDLGLGGDGFFWGTGAVQALPGNLIDTLSLKMSSKITVTGETVHITNFTFDSVQLFHDAILLNVDGLLSFSEKGITSSNWVLFGNSILKKFGRVFIDFRKNKLYLSKTI